MSTENKQFTDKTAPEGYWVDAKGILTPETLVKDIDKMRDHYKIGTVLVTCGARGSLVASEQGWSWLASVPVDVVDTIGAGDAFTAGFVAGILAGESHADSQRRATAAAARACTHAGAMG